MSATKLIHALRNLADEINALGTKAIKDGDTAEFRKLDHAGLGLQVLAHIVSGKTIERAFGAPGDWGYNTPIGAGLLAMLREGREADDSGLKWHYVDDEMPDDETRVMIALDHEHTEEPDYGYHADGKWWFDSEPHMTPVEAKVYAWAHAPGVPAKKGGAS